MGDCGRVFPVPTSTEKFRDMKGWMWQHVRSIVIDFQSSLNSSSDSDKPDTKIEGFSIKNQMFDSRFITTEALENSRFVRTLREG